MTEEPLRFAGMLARSRTTTWTDAARGVMLDQPWRTLQLAVVVLALAGVAILILRRRRFEALVAGLVLLYMTAIAALLIASPRRELVVLPLLAALAGACVVEFAHRLRRPARGWPEPDVGLDPLSARPLRAHDADRAGGDPRPRLRPARLPGGRAAGRPPATTPAPTTPSPSRCMRKAATAGPAFRDASDWSPGAPLLYAGSFYATGGAREGTARIVELLLGMAAIVVVFLLGRRIACRPAGLIAAFGVAIYPPFIHSTGALFSEPPAIFTLPAAVLAFLWAGEQERLRAWLLPGFLFGLTALIRPEYLAVGRRLRRARGVPRRQGARLATGPGAAAALTVAALLVPIVPWTVHNVVVLDRVVPVCTGGGKALYVGTYLPADGEYQRVKALLAERYLHRDLEPGSAALEQVAPAPLFDRVAALPGAAPRRGPRQGRQGELLRLPGRRPGRLRGDDRAQGLAHVERGVGKR